MGFFVKQKIASFNPFIVDWVTYQELVGKIMELSEGTKAERRLKIQKF